MEPFAPRPVGYHGIRGPEGWRLKVYSVRYGIAPMDWHAFDHAFQMAEASLPRPATTDGRPGIGFIIAHQGRTANYLVLCWWDQENELPIEVFVHPPGAEESWRPARSRESVCVWDLEIIWTERQAYVETMLNDGKADCAAYLARVISSE